MAEATPNPHFGQITLKALLENPNLFPPTNNTNTTTTTTTTPNCINADGYGGIKPSKHGIFSASEAVDMTAAFLGPTLWGTTLPSDSNLKLQYMDIDEFLAENGIQVGNSQEKVENSASVVPPTVKPLLSIHLDEMGSQRTSMTTPPPPKPSHSVDTQYTDNITNVGIKPPASPAIKEEKSPLPSPGNPPSAPSSDKVDVSFAVSSTDMALATAPGQSEYNPREKTFSEEELKPQPMVKKCKKQYIPEDLKDNKYWERRRKNNIAAKRSRDARRVKENQIVIRTSYLEKENFALKGQVCELKGENMNFKKLLASYEKKLQALNCQHW